VEASQFESAVAFFLQEHLYGHHFNPSLAPPGYPRVTSRFRRPYRTADGYVCVMPYTDAHWRAFFEEAGEATMSADPRFRGISARTRNIDSLYSITKEILGRESTEWWLAMCERREIPAAPVLSLKDVVDDLHLAAVGLFTTVADPALGRLRLPASPFKFDRARSIPTMPPRLGEHTAEVLDGLIPEEDEAADGAARASA
jgi:crotonobetainyl-CoA:carnitine CoA-transferase CaiB-like acyl-CoA transferase